MITVPTPWFYYHYKHDKNGPINNYSYEIVGLARHSEDKTHMVLYRPLYKNSFLAPAMVSARPIDNFLSDVEMNWVIVPRFSKISDEKVVQELAAIKELLYWNA